MTEDTSPENLRKFLESDDPALVRMGISLAKGAGVEVTAEDLKHFLKSDDIEAIKTGVLLAKEASIDVELTIEDLKKFLESYETEIARVGARLAIEIGIGDEALTLLCSRSEMNGSEEEIASMGDILAEFGEMAVDPVLSALYGSQEYWVISGLISVLDSLGGQRALSALIDMLGDECERLIEWNIDYNFPNDNNCFYHGRIMAAIENTWIQSEENIEHLRLSFIDIWDEETFLRLMGDMECMKEGRIDWPESWSSIYFYPLEAAKIMTRKGWKPKTEKERIDYCAVVMASEYWGCGQNIDDKPLIEWGKAAINPLIERIDNGITFVSKALAKLTEELIKTDGEYRIVKKNILEFLDIDYDYANWDVDSREPYEYDRVKKGASLLKGILEE